MGGVITQVVVPPDRSYGEITITTPRRQEYTWCIRDIERPESLSGAAVAFSIAQHRLVDASGRTFTLSDAKHCSICDQVIDLAEMNVHMADVHRVENCHICGRYVSREALRHHLNTHSRHRRRR